MGYVARDCSGTAFVANGMFPSIAPMGTNFVTSADEKPTKVTLGSVGQVAPRRMQDCQSLPLRQTIPAAPARRAECFPFETPVALPRLFRQ